MAKRLLQLLTTLLFSSATLANTFVFTAIPDEDETRLKERFQKVADYLQAELNVSVKYVPVKSYAAAVAAFRNNQVQLAWFGGLSGVRARESVPGSTALAQGVEDEAFITYFIAHTSTGLSASDDFPKGIAGKTFTFGSKGSTSGRLMPEFYVREHMGGSPESVFSRVGFSGNHSKTIALVASGAYEVGAVNFKVWDNEIAEGKIDASAVKVIWKTPTYPDYQWSIRGDADSQFGDGFTGKVKNALLGMKDKSLLDSFPRSGFIPAENKDYAPILNVGKEIGLLD